MDDRELTTGLLLDAGHLEADKDVLARVVTSPTTRNGFGITDAKTMTADYTVIDATRPESAASEVIDGRGFRLI